MTMLHNIRILLLEEEEIMNNDNTTLNHRKGTFVVSNSSDYNRPNTSPKTSNDETFWDRHNDTSYFHNTIAVPAPTRLDNNNSTFEVNNNNNMNATLNISSINNITTIAPTLAPVIKPFFQRSFKETLTMPVNVNWVIVGCMLGLLVILLIAFIILVTPLVYNYFHFKRAISPERVKKRYETIEGWMISKRVIDCNCYYHNNNKKKQSSTTTTTSSPSTDSNPLDVMNQSCLPCNNQNDTVDAAKEGFDNSCINDQPIPSSQVSSSSQYISSMRSALSPSKLFASAATSATNLMSSPRIESVSSSDSNDTDAPDDTINTNPCMRINFTRNDDIENQIEHSENNNNESFNTSQQEEDNECPICMEPFVAGEIVSWSPNIDCHHAFHHQCIKEWLVHHDSCPYCRTHYLLVDRPPSSAATGSGAVSYGTTEVIVVEEENTNRTVEPGVVVENNSNTNSIQVTPNTSAQIPQEVSTSTWRRSRGIRQVGGNVAVPTKESSGVVWAPEQLQELAKKRSNRSNTTYFCVQHGLIQLQQPKSIPRKIRKQLLSTGIDNIENELPKYRNVTFADTNKRFRFGNNTSGTNAHGNDSDEERQHHYPVNLFQYYRDLQSRPRTIANRVGPISSRDRLRLVILSLRQRVNRTPTWLNDSSENTTITINNNTTITASNNRDIRTAGEDNGTSVTNTAVEELTGSDDIEIGASNPSTENIESSVEIEHTTTSVSESNRTLFSQKTMSSDLATAITSPCDDYENDDDDDNIMTSIHSDCTFSFQEKCKTSTVQVLQYTDSININEQAITLSSFGLNITSEISNNVPVCNEYLDVLSGDGVDTSFTI
jgi:Ring finger domain